MVLASGSGLSHEGEAYESPSSRMSSLAASLLIFMDQQNGTGWDSLEAPLDLIY